MFGIAGPSPGGASTKFGWPPAAELPMAGDGSPAAELPMASEWFGAMLPTGMGCSFGCSLRFAVD